MKTKIEKLEKRISLERGLTRNSLIELLNKCITTTGKSGYSGGYSTKRIWTTEVVLALRACNIKFETGNNAPRGGAGGEYVKITDKVLLKQIASKKEKIRLINEELTARIAETKRIAKENAERIVSELPTNKTFEAKWHCLELKQLSGLSWSEYRDVLKTQQPHEWQLLKTKFKLQAHS